jgi:dynamin-like GTPase MGM1, mitochondrial
VSEGVIGVASQIKDGWNNTVEGFELPKFEPPTWLENLMRPSETKDEKHSSAPPPGPPKVEPVAVAAAVAAGIYGVDDEKERKLSQAKDDQIMLLTRKMIEIRSLLQKIGQNEDFKLPSIVVIGSQSSGKSSVLESIVGHEFLPKYGLTSLSNFRGSNMVTRRPIELTLINTPDSAAEYADFPALKLGKITDFSFVQKTLTELNLAVPAHECVSDDPIQLNIYSPSIPNLTLIDLPGYIQIHNKDQPDTLKEKISELCDKYIRDTNVILAISAADVDLANSTALRAAKRVDPKGLRTIGVITKMDLVTPEYGRAILLNNQYPLRLGYIGVVCRAPSTGTGLFTRGSSSNSMSLVSRHEQAYFAAHPEYAPTEGIHVGTAQLKKTLQQVLEKSMSQSLEGAARAIRRDLDETSYRFKVEYNDRGLTAETYLAESADALKAQFAVLETKFTKKHLHDIVKAQLDEKVLDLCAERYWMDDRVKDLPTADRTDSYWKRKLDATSGTLSRVGVGRISTEVVERALQSEVDRIVAEGTLKHSPFAQSRINEAVQEIITSRKGKTIDQVENCVKPYKYGVEVDDRDWELARERQARNLERELKMCEESYSILQREVGGRRKLGQVIQAVKSVDTGGNGGGFSNDLLLAGKPNWILLIQVDEQCSFEIARICSISAFAPRSQNSVPSKIMRQYVRKSFWTQSPRNSHQWLSYSLTSS